MIKHRREVKRGTLEARRLGCCFTPLLSCSCNKPKKDFAPIQTSELMQIWCCVDGNCLHWAMSIYATVMGENNDAHSTSFASKKYREARRQTFWIWLNSAENSAFLRFFQAINHCCHVGLPLNKARSANPWLIYCKGLLILTNETDFYEENDWCFVLLIRLCYFSTSLLMQFDGLICFTSMAS